VSQKKKKKREAKRRPPPPRDLIDFFGRWAEFREIALALSQHAALSDGEREMVHWTIQLIDRISERDLPSQG
jgi:hypothetical protein